MSSALGALGRRFESCRPDHLNPSYTSEFPRLAFLLEIMTESLSVKNPSFFNQIYFYLIYIPVFHQDHTSLGYLSAYQEFSEVYEYFSRELSLESSF